MKYDFKSGFAEHLTKFVEQKLALGFWYENSIRYLSRFDDFCCDKFSTATELTREVSFAWATKRGNENVRSFRNRISPVREFAKHLVRNGIDAYIVPDNFAKKPPRYQPYIYSKSDIAGIWAEFDKLAATGQYPARQIVLSAVVRVLYCCGLRPIEVRRLKLSDVDLIDGKLFICESKGHKDRIVMVADDLAEYLRGYNSNIGKYFANREYFFPSASGGFASSSWLNNNFLSVCKTLGICAIDGKPPRMYDLRHTMATHKLYEWMKSGEDIHERIQYLSRYMGHAQLTDTYYYIHLVPEQLQTLTGLDMSQYNNLLPEANYD
jgi:integrase